MDKEFEDVFIKLSEKFKICPNCGNDKWHIFQDVIASHIIIYCSQCKTELQIHLTINIGLSKCCKQDILFKYTSKDLEKGLVVINETGRSLPEVTEKEDEIIRKNICPDCGGSLLEGPHGGLSVNVKCEKCNTKFNVTPYPFRAERL